MSFENQILPFDIVVILILYACLNTVVGIYQYIIGSELSLWSQFTLDTGQKSADTRQSIHFADSLESLTERASSPKSCYYQVLTERSPGRRVVYQASYSLSRHWVV